MSRRYLTVGAAAWAFVALAAGLQACSHASNDSPRRLARYRIGVISSDRADRYNVSSTEQGFNVSAPRSNTDANLRVVVVADGAPISVDQEACITWKGAVDRIAQPGIALRVRTSSSRTRAITVTDNIFYGARWAFNFHVADSTPASLEEMHPIGSFMPSGFGTGFATGFGSVPPLPWRLCARVVGRRFEAKVWATQSRQGEPAYGDPAFSGSVELPVELVYSGRPGTYVGHLSPGESAAVVDGSAQRLP